MGLFDGVKKWWGNITGGTDRKAGQAAAATGQANLGAAGQAATGAQQAAGAQAQQLGKEAQAARARTAQDMGTSATDYMQKAQAAGQDFAGATARDAARQSIKAGRTAGLTGGQAALAAGQNTGQAFQQGVGQGMNQYGQATQMGAANAAQLANQQATQQNIQLGGVGQQTAAASAGTTAGLQQAQMGQEQNQNFWTGLGNAAKTVGQWVGLSDENAKYDIQPNKEIEVVEPPKIEMPEITKAPPPQKMEVGESGGGMGDIASAVMSNPETAAAAAEAVPALAAVLSDGRKKYDVRKSEIDELLKKVEPVSFRYKGEDKTQEKHQGVIAQDLEKVAPETVIETPEGVKMIDIQELKPLMLGLAKRIAGAEGEESNVGSPAELDTTLLNYLIRIANKEAQ